MSVGGSNSPFQPFPSLENLKFSYMCNWKEWVPYKGSQFPFPRLKTLKLDVCSELRGHLPCHLSSIEEVTMIDCGSLLITPATLPWLSSVKSLYLHAGSTESSLIESDSACLLQHLKIWNFQTMLSIPKMFLNTACLQHLDLYFLPSLTTFPAYGLPTSLQSLCIINCQNVAFLPPETWCSYTSLVTLVLEYSCDALTSFSLNGFPVLQSLSIEGSRNLQCFFISDISSHCQSSLKSLTVSHCDALRSLPQRMNTLTALESLSLNSLSSFCEGACLPPKLRTVYIESLRIKAPVAEWCIQNLTALSDLHIGGDVIVNTLLKEQLLPISLVSLTINKISKRKSLQGNGLLHLSSLENLTFKCCSRLELLSEDMLPSSLKSLAFLYCPKLKSLPERFPSSLEALEFDDCRRLELLPKDGLPSLKILKIGRCRMLKLRYGVRRGEHWSNIAHIPVIEVNDEVTI